MAPSVSVLTRFDCLDFQDLVSGGKGSWSTTVVPSHFQLRSYGPEHVVHLCASSLAFCCCCFFFNALVQIWAVNVHVWSHICFFILNRFIWLSITGMLPDNNTLVHFWVRSLRTRWLKYKLQSIKLGTIQNSTKTYETRVFCPSKMPSANVKRTNDPLDERINNDTTTTPMIWRRHAQNRGLWLVLVSAFCYITLLVSRDFFFSLYNTSCIGTIMLPPRQPRVIVE